MIQEVKHTPEKLQVGLVVGLAERDNHGPHGKKLVIELMDATGETLAYIVHPEHVQLFAAAPEMLSALKAAEVALSVANIAGESLYGAHVTLQVRAAILKAGGQAPGPAKEVKANGQ